MEADPHTFKKICSICELFPVCNPSEITFTIFQKNRDLTLEVDYPTHELMDTLLEAITYELSSYSCILKGMDVLCAKCTRGGSVHERPFSFTLNLLSQCI